MVGKGVGLGWRGGVHGVKATTTADTDTTHETTAETTSARSEPSPARETAETAARWAEASSPATEAHGRHISGKSIFADFKQPALPVVAVELGDGVSSVVGVFEYN